MRADQALNSAASPGFRETASAFFLSRLVENATWVAIILFAYERQGAKAAGIIVSALLLLAAVVTPVIGRYLERLQPFAASSLLLVLQFGSVILTAVGAKFDSRSITTWIGATLILCFVSCTAPVVYAILPTIARSGEALAAQNVTMAWAENAAMILGPLGAAVLLSASKTARGGMELIAGVSALFLLLALAALLRPTIRERNDLLASQESNLPANQANDHDLSSDFAEVPKTSLVRVPTLQTLLVITLASFTVVGSLDVLFLPLADASGLGQKRAGIFAAAYGLGGLLSFFASRLIVGRRRLTPSLVALGVGGALPILLLAIINATVWMPVILVLLSGAFRSVFGVVRQTLLQRSAPAGTLLRASSMAQVAITFGYSLGALIPWLSGSLVRGCVVTGLLLPLVLLLLTPRLLHIDSAADVPVTEIALLERVAIMRSLRPASLEALARRCHMRAYRPGLHIIVEGDVGHEMFVIVDGTVQITRDDQAVAELTRGDIFGEVGVLRNQPRNATATASSDVQLLAIPRSEFVDFVSLHRRVASAVEYLVDERTSVC
jgi:MFS family permease